MRAILTTWAVLLALAVPLLAADDDEPLTPERRQELEKKAGALLAEGVQEFQRGDFVKARESYGAAVVMYRTLYGGKDFPRGHPTLAASILALAGTHWATREYGPAEPLFREALDMCRALFPKTQFPDGHPQLYMSIVALASLHRDAGKPGKAEPLFREALDMCRALFPRERFPKGHRELARSLGNLAGLYQLGGDYAKAEPLFRQALDVCRAIYPKEDFPQGHADLADAISRLARLYHATGEYGKAEPLCREALAMRRGVHPKEDFPQGHTQTAAAINDLAELYHATGERGKAEPLFREALDMRRALYTRKDYPRGHADLARSIDNLACLLVATGEHKQAEPLSREALAMYRALYPRTESSPGHQDLAISINNLAFLYYDAGEYARAESLYREALDMTRALYPPKHFPGGHPQVAGRIHNLACLYQEAGEFGKAGPLYREALDMYQQLLVRYADLAAEAECLNYLRTQPLTRDGLLSVSRDRPGSASVYDTLWDGRAALTRLQERRHRDLLASRDRDTAGLADELRRTRQDLAQLLLSPAPDAARRQADVARLTEAKEDLEKRIAGRLKFTLPRSAAARPTPDGLRECLPAGAAFVDLYRYGDLEQDPAVPGRKGKRHTMRYVAFVVRQGRPVVRVALTEAAPIDGAWTAWRETLTASRPDEKAERAAAALAKLLWEPLREALPADLKTVYLAPDPKLSQVPFGALPGKKPDTVLLDESAVCLVPHGPFLLDRLGEKHAERAGDTLLAYGGVDYAGEPAAVVKLRDDGGGPQMSEKKRVKWGDLPGTAREQEQVVALAKKGLKSEPIARGGREANTRQLEEDLPKVRYAHLATHGFFADHEFRSALQVDPNAFEQLRPDRRGGARSPLVLSGLVLAGANREAKDAAPDRGIITAEGLIGLRLEGLELAVLSACETGLGEDGGGEGVYGLQRAFHVAGCKSVVASLWKVDDGATQALMALFYRNLWEKKLDAAEALRQAQLTLYRHPEAVGLARRRGADFSESDLPKVEDKAAGKPQRSPTAHWAAFTFSGVRPAEQRPQQ